MLAQSPTQHALQLLKCIMQELFININRDENLENGN